MRKKLYIAYGSNLNIAQMKRRCPDARPIGTGIMEDWKLVFRGNSVSGVCNIVKSPGDCVPVGIWEISEMDERSLDRYEGYPHLYRKETVNLAQSGRPRKALIYIMNYGSPAMPGKGYVETCSQGYRDFGLPLEMWDEAIEFNRKECMK